MKLSNVVPEETKRNRRSTSEAKCSPLTCYGRGVPGAFATSYEDNIALAGVRIVVLEEEELVDAVFLEGSDFDYSTNGAG